MVIEVTKDDLRRALSVNTNKRCFNNCILAQAIKRQTGVKNVSVYDTDNTIRLNNRIFRGTKKISNIVASFDDGQYEQLRNQLPTTIRLMN